MKHNASYSAKTEELSIARDIAEFEKNLPMCVRAGTELDEKEYGLRIDKDLCVSRHGTIAVIGQGLSQYEASYSNQPPSRPASRTSRAASIGSLMDPLPSTFYPEYQRQVTHVTTYYNSTTSYIIVNSTKISYIIS